MAFTGSVDEIVKQNKNGLLGKHHSWPRVRLSDSARIQNGAAFKSTRFNTEGQGTPLLRIRDVRRGSTETWYDGDYDDAYVVKQGDLVIGMDGDFNHALWAGPNALLNQRVCRLIWREGAPLLEKFAFYVLGGYLDAINDATPSVTVKHLSSKTIGEIPLPAPPLEEQRRIVEQIEAARAEMQRGLDSVAHARKRAEELVRSAVEQEIGALRDDGCEELSPADLASNAPHALAIGPFGSNLKVSDYSDRGVPLVFVRNIRAKDFGGAGTKFISVGKAEELRAHQVAGGDLLITKMGDPPGDCTIYPPGRPHAIITADCIRFAVDDTRARPDYIASLFQTAFVKRQIHERTKGVAQRKISLKTFKTIGFPVPDLNRQERIADRLSELRDVQVDLNQHLDAAEDQAVRLDQSVFHAAFSGAF